MMELALALLAIVVSIAITLHTRPRTLLITLVILTALLSGAQWEWVNEAGVSLRRLCIGLLAILAVQSRTHLPFSVKLLGCASLIGLAGLIGYRPEGSESGLSVTAALLLLHWPAAKTIYGWLHEGNRERLGLIFIWTAAIHISLTTIALLGFGGAGRFAGAGASSPLFAFNGAALLAALLWGSTSYSRRVQRSSLTMIPIIVLLTLLSAQRSAVLLMIAASAPHVATLSARRIRTLVVTAVLAAGSILLVARSSGVLDYAFGRLRIRDTTAREERWSATLELILERPVLGWGAGFRDTLGFGVHNSYLSLLVELGLLGAALWVASTAIGIHQTFIRTSVRQHEHRALGLLARSWLFVSIAGALVEDKLYRPSNMPALVFILALLLGASLREYPQGPTSRLGKPPPNMLLRAGYLRQAEPPSLHPELTGPSER